MQRSSLLTRCKLGDARAWQELFQRYVSAVYRWGLCFGLDRHSAEEVTQEVFATAARRIAGVADAEQLPSWLFQITRRHAANARRLAWLRLPRARSTEDGSELEGIASQDPPCRELSVDIRRALSTLPANLVEILILHDLDGHTREEIAALLAIAPGTVASRLAAARQRFARALDVES